MRETRRSVWGIVLTVATALLSCSSPLEYSPGVGNGNAQFRHLLSGHMFYSNGEPVGYGDGQVTVVPIDYNPLDPAYKHLPLGPIAVVFDSCGKYTFDSLDCRKYSLLAAAIRGPNDAPIGKMELLFKNITVTEDMAGFPNDTLRPNEGYLQINARLRPFPACRLALGIIGTNLVYFSDSGNFTGIDFPAGNCRVVIKPVMPIRQDTIIDVEIKTGDTVKLAVDLPYIVDPGKDSASVEKLKRIKTQLPGSYTGTCYYACWLPQRVVFTVDSNGRYSGYNADYSEIPLLYFIGNINDLGMKAILLNKIGYDGSAEGTIWTGCPDYFSYDTIRQLRFSTDFDSLYFEIWHDGISYGMAQQYVVLHRTAVDSLPPRPLPLPKIYTSGQLYPAKIPDDYGKYIGPVKITMTAEEGDTILYQIHDEPRGWLCASTQSYLTGLYPTLINDTWNDNYITHVYTGPFTITEKPYYKTILARAVKGKQRSGTAGYNVVIVNE
jgi:hypothetical protein